jgi:hypothetical protein
MAMRRERVGWSPDAGVAACAIYTVRSSRYLIEATIVSVVFVQQVALLFALVLLIGSVVLSDPASLAGVSQRLP